MNSINEMDYGSMTYEKGVNSFSEFNEWVFETFNATCLSESCDFFTQDELDKMELGDGFISYIWFDTGLVHTFKSNEDCVKFFVDVVSNNEITQCIIDFESELSRFYN